MMFKKILLPHDISRFSDKALQVALDLAKLNYIRDKGIETDIILLNIIPEIHITSDVLEISNENQEKATIEQYLQDKYNEKRKEIEKKLDDIKEKHKSREANILSSILIGDPSNKIVEVAEREGVDLIVIGSNTAKTIKGLGSVSRYVSERTTTSILIVR